MHQGTVAGRASPLLRGNIRRILEDVVDRDQLPASPAGRGSLESWRRIASIRHLRKPIRVGPGAQRRVRTRGAEDLPGPSDLSYSWQSFRSS
jgi:hypothetical protein